VPTKPRGVEVRTIVLIGFMAAGKSTAGRIAAERLGWSLVDLDAEIEARTGTSIEALFRDRGETAFRAIELELTPALLQRDHAVLATGGGWATQPGTLDALPPSARSVWLDVSAGEAVRRAAASGTVRPLLETADPVATAQALLDARKQFYERADVRIDVNGRSPQEIADDIVKYVLNQ
jgi:shikimate kinase